MESIRPPSFRMFEKVGGCLQFRDLGRCRNFHREPDCQRIVVSDSQTPTLDSKLKQRVTARASANKGETLRLAHGLLKGLQEANIGVIVTNSIPHDGKSSGKGNGK